MARRISQDEKAKGGPELGEADEGMLGAGSLSAPSVMLVTVFLQETPGISLTGLSIAFLSGSLRTGQAGRV